MFSFLGLLITEVIPSVFTLSLYNRVRTLKSATKGSSNSKETKSKPSLASGTEVEMKESKNPS